MSSGYAISYWPDTELVKGWRSIDSVGNCDKDELFWPIKDGFPPSPVPAPLTPAEEMAIQSSKLSNLIAECNAQKTALTNRISTIQDAIDLEMATEDEVEEKPIRAAQLKAWKTYGVLLGRVTVQTGWWTDVIFPTKPTDGMDLTVNGSSLGSS